MSWWPSCLAGDFWPWALQFVATLWSSTFLIVSSHDFEDDTDEHAATNTEDWGMHQLEEAYDLKVVGNRYVDCFLSAGLSSHRVHHVLPYQRSGFANITTEERVARRGGEVRYRVASRKEFRHRSASEARPHVSPVTLPSSGGTTVGIHPRTLLTEGLEGQCHLRGVRIRRTWFGVSLSGCWAICAKRENFRILRGRAAVGDSRPSLYAVRVCVGAPSRVFKLQESVEDSPRARTDSESS